MHLADPFDFQESPGGLAGGGRGGGTARGAGWHRARRCDSGTGSGTGAGRPGRRAAPVAQRSPSNGGWTPAQMKKKYGEITMLDFPQFTKDTFPGVTHMDLFSGLFGDVTDDSHVRRPHLRSDDAVGPQVAGPAAANMVTTA